MCVLRASPQFPDWSGLRFTEIAELAGHDEWDCYFDVLSAAGPAMGELCMVGDLFTEEHLSAHDLAPPFQSRRRLYV